MVLKTRLRPSFLLALVLAFPLLAFPSGAAAEAPPPGEVNLPLKDYLALVDKAEAVEKERARQLALRQAPVAEVVSQKVRLVIDDQETAAATTDMEILVQGMPKGPIALPVSGVPQKAEVKLTGSAGANGAALTSGAQSGKWLLVAPAPGRYSVKISGPVPFSGRITLAPAAAPISLTEVELPAELAWSAPGVVVEDRVEGKRRTVRLTTRRGESQVVEVRRKVEGGEAEKLLARSVVLTLIQLRPEGPRRHDVVLYEVSRGGLPSFTVDLPEGLVVEAVGTDEGDVTPVVEARRLTVNRRQQLRGVGYLVLTSTPASGAASLSAAELPVDPVVPLPAEGAVRGRYVALASSVAADVHPVPASSWARVDLDDLPSALREALGGVDLAAAWRLTGQLTGSQAVPGGLRMAVAPLPAAPSLPAVASLRETTTLLTLDGTLLHRERITLRPGAVGNALDLTLPTGATLWSAKVDEVPVRPLERGNGRISVPLGFDAGKAAVVEIVAVLAKAIPAGRSDLAFELPRVAVPVLEHRWRLLLPDGASYRYRSGDLRPVVLRTPAPQPRGRISTGATVSVSELEKIPTARDPWALLQATPGVLTDGINVGGNESGQQAQYVGPGAAQLRGRIVDDHANPLPGVGITLRFAGQPPRIAVTNAGGLFLFAGLLPGTYQLETSLEGFSTVNYPATLAQGQTRSIEVRLNPAAEDVIAVTSESPLRDERQRAAKRKDEPAASPVYYDFDAFEEMKSLKQGLVGGVKPLPIAIPETGKLLLMTGVLPPEKIAVALEVKGKK
jgi:hypothetical protein